ncbi:putative Homeobox protein arx, partial [Operophtera brumata]
MKEDAQIPRGSPKDMSEKRENRRAKWRKAERLKEEQRKREGADMVTKRDPSDDKNAACLEAQQRLHQYQAGLRRAAPRQRHLSAAWVPETQGQSSDQHTTSSRPLISEYLELEEFTILKPLKELLLQTYSVHTE